MVWPLIAIAAVSAAAQYYQSEKARGASAGRLKDLEKEFDALVPPGYDMHPMDPPAYLETKLKSPQFDGDLTPTMANYVEEAGPTQIQGTADAATGKTARMEALRRMQSIGNSNFDPGLAASLSEAGVTAKRDAQGRAGAVRDRYRRRGALDSGMAMLSEIQENASANETQALMGQRAAADSYQNRLAAVRDAARMGGDIQRDETDVEARNAGIINDFNQRTSKNRQLYENQRAGTLNDAAVSNQTRRDSLQKYEYDNQRQERDAQNRIIEAQQKWRSTERDRGDSLRDKMYQDQVKRAALKKGLIYDGKDKLDYEKAANNNRAIQGVADAGSSYYSGEADRDERAASENRKDRRARYQKTGKWSDEDEEI